LIELSGVEKVYRNGKVAYQALKGVDLTIERGDMVAIVGPSGSGKSTVMNMTTGIDRPSAGTVTVDGHRIDEMSEEELAIWRGGLDDRLRHARPRAGGQGAAHRDDSRRRRRGLKTTTSP